MTACLFEALPNGGFVVSRTFSDKAAAFAGLNKLLSVVEEGFVPVDAPPLDPAVEALKGRTEAQDTD